jgi:hypothetical protein
MRFLKSPILLFGLFLVYYIYDKYMGAAPEAFNIAYAKTVAIIVLLTAILPFIISYFSIKAVKGAGSYILALLLPTICSALGYAVFFYQFIAPFTSEVELMQVVPRSLIPGLAISLILIATALLKRKTP